VHLSFKLGPVILDRARSEILPLGALLFIAGRAEAAAMAAIMKIKMGYE